MQNSKSILSAAGGAVLLCLLLTGCSTLFPKRVEIGQSKVQAIPSKTAKAAETEKQAAAYVASKVAAARDAVLTAGPTNAIPPLTDARDAAQGLSYSLGAPLAPWTDSGAALAARLGLLEARLDREIDRAREKQAPLVGKKIEGTGVISVPYFLWLGIVAGAVFLLWTGLKILSLVYPPVGLGVAGLSGVGRVSASLVRKSLEQVVAGAESFKAALDKSGLEDKVKQDVLDLFRRHQMVSQQDPAVQDLVRKLTR